MADDVRPPSPPLPRELVLSGGGTGGLAMLGALHRLREAGRLARVTRWVGASVGSIVASLLLSGYTPLTVYKVLEGLDFAGFAGDVNGDNVLGFFDTMGAMEPTQILRLFDVMLRKQGYDDTVTLAGFDARTGHTLVIAGYNVTRGETVAFSAQTHPRMPLRLAVRISISVPILFRPVMYEGELYVDGAVMEHVPTRFAKYKRRSLVVHCYNDQPPVWPVATNLMELTLQLLKQLARRLEDACVAKARTKRPETVVRVKVPQREGGNGVVDFGLDAGGKRGMFEGK